MKDKIIEALELNKLAYESVKNSFKRGMSEKDVKNIILSACSASDDNSGDIVGGVRASQIEGDATDYILKDGDCLILDLQFKMGNVWTDTTRTFFIGTPSQEQRCAYELCLLAKKMGEEALKSGVGADTIYESLKSAFGKDEDKFPHHAGHLFGTERLIKPQFLPEFKDAVKTNDFVTLEPGIYYENKFGIRIEDNYQITENGFINLFDYPAEIDYFII